MMPDLKPTIPSFSGKLNSNSPSSSTNSTTFSWTDRSSSTSHSSEESKVKEGVVFRKNTTTEQKITPIRTYGEGWIQPTRSPAYYDSARLLDIPSTPMLPNRTRSPSAPASSSHSNVHQYCPSEYSEGATLAYSATDAPPSALRQLGVSLHPVGTTYQPAHSRRYLISSLLSDINRSGQSQSYLPSFRPFDDDVSSSARDHLPLHARNHHFSVPDLHRMPPYPEDEPAVGRKRSSVRFAGHLQDLSEQHCDIDEFDKEVSHVANRLSSKSMPAISLVGQRRNVYIPHFDSSCTEDQLCEIASTFGRVISTHLGKPEGGVMSQASFGGAVGRRLYAFVMFELPDQAADFMAYLRSQSVECEYGKEDFQTEYKSLEDLDSSNLYIQGFDGQELDSSILDFLAMFGEVKSWKRFRNQDNKPKGPLMVRYDSRAQAERVIKELHGRMHSITQEKFAVRIADSARQKKLKLEVRVCQLVDQPGGPPESGRRASLPTAGRPYENHVDKEALDHKEALDQRKRQLKEELLALERYQMWTSESTTAVSSRFAPRQMPSPCTPQTPSGVYSPQPAYHHRHTSSSFSSDLQTPTSALHPSSSHQSWLHSPTSYTPTQQHSLGAALHHTRSSPELGFDLKNPAKLLWADAYQGESPR